MWCKIEGASSLLCDKKHRSKVFSRYINESGKLNTDYCSSVAVIIARNLFKYRLMSLIERCFSRDD